MLDNSRREGILLTALSALLILIAVAMLGAGFLGIKGIGPPVLEARCVLLLVGGAALLIVSFAALLASRGSIVLN